MRRRKTKQRLRESFGQIQMLDGLGDPPATHKRKYIERLRASRQAARQAQELAAAGKCERAINALVHAHEAFGEARAHMPKTARGAGLADTLQNLRDAQRNSFQACVVLKPKRRR